MGKVSIVTQRHPCFAGGRCSEDEDDDGDDGDDEDDEDDEDEDENDRSLYLSSELIPYPLSIFKFGVIPCGRG